MQWMMCATPALWTHKKIQRDLGKVSGVLLPGVTAFFLAKDVFGHNDGNPASVHEFFG
jgi:hypothetical protein